MTPENPPENPPIYLHDRELSTLQLELVRMLGDGGFERERIFLVSKGHTLEEAGLGLDYLIEKIAILKGEQPGEKPQ